MVRPLSTFFTLSFLHTGPKGTYIRCTEVTTSRCICVFPKKKPWMRNEVHVLLRECDAAYRAENRGEYSMARHGLKRGIGTARAAYKERTECEFVE